jgi:hypothetical protein
MMPQLQNAKLDKGISIEWFCAAAANVALGHHFN